MLNKALCALWATARPRTSSCSVAVAIGLAGPVVRLPVCGTFLWWHCNDARGSICNGVWWLQPPSYQCGRPRTFWSLPAQPCRAQWETRRLQSAGGLQWVQENLDWYERTKAYSAFVRSDQSATVASECAGEGLKGPWEEGVVGPWGEKIWEWVVCKRPGFF